jgi:hypothetical protein
VDCFQKSALSIFARKHLRKLELLSISTLKPVKWSVILISTMKSCKNGLFFQFICENSAKMGVLPMGLKS